MFGDIQNNQNERSVSEVIVRDMSGNVIRRFAGGLFSSLRVKSENGRMVIVEPGFWGDRVYSPSVSESVEIR